MGNKQGWSWTLNVRAIGGLEKTKFTFSEASKGRHWPSFLPKPLPSLVHNCDKYSLEMGTAPSKVAPCTGDRVGLDPGQSDPKARALAATQIPSFAPPCPTPVSIINGHHLSWHLSHTCSVPSIVSSASCVLTHAVFTALPEGKH